MRYRCLLVVVAILAPGVVVDLSAAATPRLVVSSLENLTDGSLISVAVTDAPINTSISIRQCYDTKSTDQCWTYATGLQSSDSDPITIRASRSNFWGAPLGPLVDCGVIQCFLHVEASQAFQAPYIVRDFALSFDATPPTIRQPIAIVSPHAGLVGQQVVRISGLGFTPSAEYRVRQCWVPFTYPWLQRCTQGSIAHSNNAGVVVTPFVVRRRFSTPLTTCGDGNTPCFLIVQRVDDPTERAMVMISFTGRTFERSNLVPGAISVYEDVGIAMVPVRLDANPDRLTSTAAFSWNTRAWTATSADFEPGSRTVVISPYLPVVYLPVRIVDDDVPEADEAVLTKLTSSVNVGIGGYDGIGAVVIIDND